MDTDLERLFPAGSDYCQNCGVHIYRHHFTCEGLGPIAEFVTELKALRARNARLERVAEAARTMSARYVHGHDNGYLEPDSAEHAALMAALEALEGRNLE